MKIAVIDVGSNSVRYACITDPTKPAKKELCSTVLADGLFFSGKLSPAAMARTVDAIEKFCTQADTDGADAVEIFATEAVRAASNGKEFTDAVFARTGKSVHVIGGDEEARIGFLGASPDPAVTATVFDMGGASCEIVCGKGGKLLFSQSCPIGCVRLRDGADGRRDTAQALIEKALPSALPDCDRIIGIGGSATALGAMAHCSRRYDPEIVHDSFVSQDFLRQTADEFFGGADMAARYPSLSPARAKIIGYGALAALSVLARGKKDGFTVSERDNMEGYVLAKICK